MTPLEIKQHIETLGRGLNLEDIWKLECEIPSDKWDNYLQNLWACFVADKDCKAFKEWIKTQPVGLGEYFGYWGLLVHADAQTKAKAILKTLCSEI